ncbi:MAG: GNAT family N-acetyltransferase [Coriobacteriia bacterium]|nr:GNAT family N-acetyltransferase [Coriobacteriia bacterium]
MGATSNSSCFDNYFTLNKVRSGRENLKIDLLKITDLLPEDISELDKLRTAALNHYDETIVQKCKRIPIEDEIKYVPARLSMQDKLIFRAFEQANLLAYAQVFTGWPHFDEWTVEQLYIHPEYARQGLGSKLINSVENVARTAEIKATSVLTMPSREHADSFWRAIGYDDLSANQTIQVPRKFSNLRVLRKEL